MNNIKISVVIPCYNCADYITETLQSVFEQTELPDEIVLVDDGSSDNTVSIILSIKDKHPEIEINLVQQINSGPGAARNKGIEKATGEWIAFLDSDDKWRKKKIESVRHAIRENGNVVLVSHDICEVYDTGEMKEIPLHNYYHSNESAFVQLYHGCFLSTSSVCALRSVLLKVGGFDIALLSAQDYDLWLRVGQEGKFFFIPEIFEEYWVRRGSISGNIMLRYNCLMKICTKYAADLPLYVKRKQADRLVLRFILTAHRDAVKGFNKEKRYVLSIRIMFQAGMEIMKVFKGDYLKC